MKERLDLKAVACFLLVLSSLSDCLHINRALLPMGSVVCPQHTTAAAAQHTTAAAAVSQLIINSLFYYTNRTLLVIQDLLLFINIVSAWSAFYRAQMLPFEERDAGFAA